MTKFEIINDLLVKHNVWQCAYTRCQLEQLTKKKLLVWLKRLNESSLFNFKK